MAEPARTRLTVDALDALDDDGHAEIIGGELVRETMTSFAHGDAQMSIASELKPRFRDGGEGQSGWWLASEVTVVYERSEGYVHDVAGWRKDRVPTRPAGRKITIRPDWVCEILSTNKRKDLVDKRRTLHQHGVPHYWVLDPEGLSLTVLRHGEDGYVIAAVAFPGDRARLEPFDAEELDVTRLFGDIEPVPEE
jgi:Uma2 family endonuclease